MHLVHVTSTCSHFTIRLQWQSVTDADMLFIFGGAYLLIAVRYRVDCQRSFDFFIPIGIVWHDYY